MNIQWYGQTCFKIQTKINGEEITVVTDPISKESGLRQSKMNANVITMSDYKSKRFNTSAISGAKEKEDPFMIIGAGEYETKGIFVTGVDTSIIKEDKQESFNVTYRYDIEGMRIVHLGLAVAKKLNEEQIEALGLIDVLILPVGGGDSLSYEQAVKMVGILEPRIVIPMFYNIDGINEKLDDVVRFAKELGVSDLTPEKKVKIVKSELPQDEMQIIILDNA